MLRYAWCDVVRALGDDGLLTFLEVFPENYFRRGGARRRDLLALAEDFPITSHGVHLSIAGDALSDDYVAELAAFLEMIEAPWASDHLGISVHDGELLHEILPVARNAATAARITARLERLAGELPCELCLENAAYYVDPPGCDQTELAFLLALIEQAGLRLIFDVNNLWVNAANHGYDPNAFLEALPHDCVREIHIGGFTVDTPTGLLIDSHEAMPSAPVWALLEQALRRFGPVPVLLEIERDDVTPEALRRTLERVAATIREAASGAGRRGE